MAPGHNEKWVEDTKPTPLIAMSSKLFKTLSIQPGCRETNSINKHKFYFFVDMALYLEL